MQYIITEFNIIIIFCYVPYSQKSSLLSQNKSALGYIIAEKSLNSVHFSITTFILNSQSKYKTTPFEQTIACKY